MGRGGDGEVISRGPESEKRSLELKAREVVELT